MENSIKKAVILAGGLGTRFSEETSHRPKPLIEIGGKPILWHIMKIYHHHGIKEFVICLGYKGYLIKEYFANYFLHTCDITFDMGADKTVIHNKRTEDWKVTLIDTGLNTMTGGRLRRIKSYLGPEPFCMTYGDGVANIDISSQIAFHNKHGLKATMTAVTPPGRFGALEMDGDVITGFREKPSGDGGLINGGFFILSPETLEHVEADDTVWEQFPLETLAKIGELKAFSHSGFWQPMDTLRDKNMLEGLWESGNAPWRVWA